MSRPITVLGVPMDLGAARRGVEMGPSAVRLARLEERLEALGHVVRDDGDVPVPTRETLGAGRGIDYLPTITTVCRDLASRTARIVAAGEVPLVLGGDHSIAAGSVAGAANAVAATGGRLGVIWLDAHTDLHVPTSSETGNIHGMPVAHLLGKGDPDLAALASDGARIAPHHLVIVGARDVDQGERAHAQEWGIRVFTMREIDERGMRAVLQEAIELVSDGTTGIHVSLDLDFVDPQEAPGVGTPVRGGATYREAHLAMEMLHDTKRIVSMDLVEVNPVLDRFNHTAELAVGLVASGFGQRIL
ncbi:MAG: arginase [Gemmatimonadetes bacterium]|nr:arginase [Gemmatimonadota bacterium]MCB9505164.1 arginase [Gemmatimonadales bacterium]MCA9762167.1 arginase [Gemmatimonadota bacterium]MCB9518662.1 arginase [Gemmatimonadales bacterium]HPF61473.1 arginase [Gemmatimonadales bacterium]